MKHLLNFQDSGQRWYFIMMLLISLLWFGGEAVIDQLAYNSDAIEHGQYWRILTGHLVHSNGWHLVLNLASLTLIGLLFGQCLSARQWALCFIYCAVTVSGLYYFIATEYTIYVGLSAVLYGAIIVGAIEDLKQHKLIAGMLLIIVTARVIWQQFSGAPQELADMIEDRVAIESHLFGLASGYFFALGLFTFRYFDKAGK